MKFVIRWSARPGRSPKARRRDLRESLQGFVRWLAPDDQVFHQFVVRADGAGGFAVVETDRAAGLLDSAARFSPWFEFEVIPVLDIAEAVGALNRAASWLDFVNATPDAPKKAKKHKKKHKHKKKGK
jgi:Domain of unknown function (DUF3303)